MLTNTARFSRLSVRKFPVIWYLLNIAHYDCKSLKTCLCNVFLYLELTFMVR